ARAHALRPVVMVGEAGLTPALLREIDASLKAHELIKIRVAGDDRRLRESTLESICVALGAAPVQHIGKMLVVFRERPEAAPPRPAAPPPRQRALPRRSARTQRVKRT
ncbi:MAG TPA: YhbY family RNA-binding protein, partial [Burkholderiales bacterium]|nr:YhbY family RNA-binding protein [Burkholderiales bacterium]